MSRRFPCIEVATFVCAMAIDLPMAASAAPAASIPSSAPAASQSPGARAVPVCAIIGDRAAQAEYSGLIALLETKLSSSGNLSLVERNEIDKVLKEQELQLLFAPESGSRRSVLGSLLKADLLILLRTGRAGQATKGKLLDLTICETKGGLRLRLATIKASDTPENAALQIAALTDEALAKCQSPLRHVVATPDFVSKDLSYQYDHLKTLYARLVDQRLATEPDLVVVELAEARAISEELALADKAKAVGRPLPFYLMGEYRTTADGDRLTVQLELSLRQGEKVLGGRKSDRLKDTDALSFVPKAALELLRETAGTVAARSDPVAEARQLSDRAQIFMQTANWEEALRLTEAAILLQPNDPALRWQAARALGEMAGDSRRPAVSGASRPGLATQPGYEEYLHSLVSLWSCYSRMTEHIKAGVELTDFPNLGQSRQARVMDILSSPIRVYRRETIRAPVASAPVEHIIAALDQLDEKYLPDLVDILDRKIRPGRVDGNTLWAFKRVMDHWTKTEDVSLRYSQMVMHYAAVVQNREGAGQTILQLLDLNVILHALKEMEAGRLEHWSDNLAWRILDPQTDWVAEALEEMPGKETQAAAVAIRKLQQYAPGWLAQVEKRVLEKDIRYLEHSREYTIVHYYRNGSPGSQRLKKGQLPVFDAPRSPRAEVPDSIRLAQVELSFETETGEPISRLDGVLLGWIPCAAGTDVAWTSRQLFVMHQKGRFTQIFKAAAGAFDRRDAVAREARPLVCFDGKYVWAPAALAKDPYLLAVDLESGKHRRITTAEGLPPAQVGFCVAAISPGKVCVAAAFGKPGAPARHCDRSWCCEVELGPSGDVKVKTLLEATRQPERRFVSPMLAPEPDVVFQPSALVPLRDKADRRVTGMLLITIEGRGIHIDLQNSSARSLPGAVGDRNGRLNVMFLTQIDFEPADLFFLPAPFRYGVRWSDVTMPENGFTQPRVPPPPKAIEQAACQAAVFKDGVIYVLDPAYEPALLVGRDLLKPLQRIPFRAPQGFHLFDAQLCASNHYGMVLLGKEALWPRHTPWAVEVRPGSLEILDRPRPIAVHPATIPGKGVRFATRPSVLHSQPSVGEPYRTQSLDATAGSPSRDIPQPASAKEE